MFKFTKEGELPINGFNFYPVLDRGSRGFRIRVGRYVTYFRYSTYTKKFKIFTTRWNQTPYPKTNDITFK